MGAQVPWDHARRRPTRTQTPDAGARASAFPAKRRVAVTDLAISQKVTCKRRLCPSHAPSGSTTIRGQEGSRQVSRTLVTKATGHGQRAPTGGGVASALCPRRSFAKTGRGRADAVPPQGRSRHEGHVPCGPTALPWPRRADPGTESRTAGAGPRGRAWGVTATGSEGPFGGRWNYPDTGQG